LLKWKKLGLVWAPDGSNPQALHSALQPTPILIDEENIRVFFGCRDKDGVSRIFSIDLSAKNPLCIKSKSLNPILDIGEPGCFDESGVVPCCVIHVANKLRIYYAGYMRPTLARFIAYSGAVESDENYTNFRRISRVPLLDRTDAEPLFRAVHSIIREEGKFRCWYGAGEKFITGQEKSLPLYNIRYIESEDGIIFPSVGKIAVDVAGDEHRVGRPNVTKISNDQYLMIYGFGSELNPYKLGMAISSDGLFWVRNDGELGLGLSESGWDSQMMAYPAFLKTKYGSYMFYNGNDYGKNGFGCAKLIGSLF
jgi:hypothetical protein